MAKRKMKQLALAVGTVLGGLAMVPSAQAVNLATDGLGQVLIFPYYTTRGDWTTLINITNTSNLVVAAKVRFHEAYNSRDVLDFTVVLSPFDVWTAWVENGPGEVPRLRTNDTSCTVPAIPSEGQTFAGGLISYTGAAADGGPDTLDRTREGYVKVLMNGADANFNDPRSLSWNAVHGANGVPRNCGIIRQAFGTAGGIAALRGAFPLYDETINPLKGTFNLVNGPRGLTAGGGAVALADFYRRTLPPNYCNSTPSDFSCYVPGPEGLPAAGGAYSTNYMATLQLPPDQTGNFNTSFHEPNLNAANTQGQVLLASGQVATSVADAPDRGANAVNFAIRRTAIHNQWTRRTDLATGWGTASDWVVTFPTKRYYVDFPAPPANPNAGNEMQGRAAGRAGLPEQFPAPFFAQRFNGASCHPVRSRIFDREEFAIDDGPVFSPSPRGSSLCYEANVLSFDGSSILGSASAITSNVAPLPGRNGWMRLDLQGPRPVVGFSITTRDTGDGALNEAFLVDHAYTTGR